MPSSVWLCSYTITRVPQSWGWNLKEDVSLEEGISHLRFKMHYIAGVDPTLANAEESAPLWQKREWKTFPAVLRALSSLAIILCRWFYWLLCSITLPLSNSYLKNNSIIHLSITHHESRLSWLDGKWLKKMPHFNIEPKQDKKHCVWSFSKTNSADSPAAAMEAAAVKGTYTNSITLCIVVLIYISSLSATDNYNKKFIHKENRSFSLGFPFSRISCHLKSYLQNTDMVQDS